MLSRVLELEVMDSEADAVDYDSMDHSAVNRAFADQLLALISSQTDPTQFRTALDTGTGTALIPIEVCLRSETLQVTGVDLASHMLQLGLRNILQAGLSNRIRLEQIDAKSLPFADGEFDVVMSNSIIHHIPEPRDCFAEMARVLRPGGLLFVRDLLRPEDEAQVEALVDLYAAGATEPQRALFRNSLRAALSLDEVAALLVSIGLPETWVRQSSDRHWTVAGIR